MQLKVLKVIPYVINIRELEMKRFKQAKKRELISAFNFDLSIGFSVAQADLSQVAPNPGRSELLLSPDDALEERKKPKMKFKTKSSLEAKMSPIQAQVSMDDLYVV